MAFPPLRFFLYLAVAVLTLFYVFVAVDISSFLMALVSVCAAFTIGVYIGQH